MSYRRTCMLLLAGAVGLVPALAGADVARPIPNAERLGPISTAALPAAQLEDLVAPIALYPDALLSQVLVASTYPLEVVEAKQWLQRRGDLQGAALIEEAKKQRWDASVQSLVAFPEVLDTLTQDIGWTSSLGDAFLAQEADVMAAVQRLRSRAQAAGKLVSTAEQQVISEEREAQTVVQIVPAATEVVYVPRYDPYYVWGPPAWSAYPPLYYAPGYAFSVGVDVGFWFGGWTWGWGWGWYPNWHGGSVWVNGGWFNHCGYRYAHYDPHGGRYHGGYGPGHAGGGHGGPSGGHGGHGGGGPEGSRMAWSHDPGHRQGVPYSSGRNASRYEAASRASRASSFDAGWRSGRETARSYGGDPSTAAGRSGGDRGWRDPGSASRHRGSGAPERLSTRGSGSESWRNPGVGTGSAESRRRDPVPLRSADPGWRNPSSSRAADSGWRDRSAAPRSFEPSPRSPASSGWASPRRSSPQEFRAAPRGERASGGGWPSGNGRSWSGNTGPRSSSGPTGGGGSPRGSGGGYSGGSSRSGGGSSGGGHRGGGGRH